MLIVTGPPRSGTSMAMQTLYHLQYPVFGITYPNERSRKVQPSSKPLWEFPSTLRGNYSILPKRDYIAVKTILRAVIRPLIFTNEDIFILCKRDIDLIIKSQQHSGIRNSLLKDLPGQYEKFYEIVGTRKYMEYNLEIAREDPETFVKQVKEFSGALGPIGPAIENIERKGLWQ
jgi:hypothetical protein